MEGLKAAGVELDRKVLSDVAIHDDAAFQSLVRQSLKALEKKGVPLRAPAKAAKAA